MDPKLKKIAFEVHQGMRSDHHLGEDGILGFQGRLCVPDVPELKREILDEAHNSKFAMHPGSTKMYRNLKDHYYWLGMKRDIAEHVSRCLTCQQVKASHMKSPGLLQSIPIPEWKWEEINMDFVVGLPMTRDRHDAIWVIVDRLTKSAHYIPINNTYSMDRLDRYM